MRHSCVFFHHTRLQYQLTKLTMTFWTISFVFLLIGSVKAQGEGEGGEGDGEGGGNGFGIPFSGRRLGYLRPRSFSYGIGPGMYEPQYIPPDRPLLFGDGGFEPSEPLQDEFPPEPFDEFPSEPFDEFPSEPFDEFPPEPFDEFPPEPFDEFPSEPFDEFPPEPFDEFPSEPFDEFPPEPFDEFPSEPFDEYPPEPFDEFPPEPFDEYPPEIFDEVFDEFPPEPFDEYPYPFPRRRLGFVARDTGYYMSRRLSTGIGRRTYGRYPGVGVPRYYSNLRYGSGMGTVRYLGYGRRMIGGRLIGMSGPRIANGGYFSSRRYGIGLRNGFGGYYTRPGIGGTRFGYMPMDYMRYPLSPETGLYSRFGYRLPRRLSSVNFTGFGYNAYRPIPGYYTGKRGIYKDRKSYFKSPKYITRPRKYKPPRKYI